MRKAKLPSWSKTQYVCFWFGNYRYLLFKYGENCAPKCSTCLITTLRKKANISLQLPLRTWKEGRHFVPGQVQEWLDCGNKSNMVQNQPTLPWNYQRSKAGFEKATVKNSVLLQPVFIADGVTIENSVIGPYVSIGRDTKISDSRISNSIVQKLFNQERSYAK